MSKKRIQTLFAVTRPKFLALVPACVLPGIATARLQAGTIRTIDVLIVSIGALMAHIAVNVLNEYHDFRSGLDYVTAKTPFSGGSGMLPANPDHAPAALMLGLGALALSGLTGIYFTFTAGVLVWIPAIIGTITIVLYTGVLNRYPFLCLIAPGIGFGACMVTGVHYALAGQFSIAALAASFIPFFLVSNLLLLNQFPDVEADRSIGRRHYPITIGRQKSAAIFVAFLAGAYLTIMVSVLLNIFPAMALIGLSTLLIAVPMIMGIVRHADTVEKLLPFMGMNVLVTLLTPILTAVGILLG
jgi:1,4-dihydroxy-2-naphthoate polyprenyltransferase